MRHIKLFIAVVVAALSLTTFSGCETTGNGVGDIKNWFNSATVQNALKGIQDTALAFVNAWIHSHLGASRSLSNSSVQSSMDDAILECVKQYPNIPRAMIELKVKAVYAEKLK